MQMKEWLIEHKLPVGLVVLIAFGSLYYYYNDGPRTTNQNFSQTDQAVVSQPPKVEQKLEQKKLEQQKEGSDRMIVDVKGGVKQPGVYEASSGERVIDVIKRAGGMIDDADGTQVNFAAHVEDEMIIYVPVKGETPPSLPQASVSESAATTGSASAGGAKGSQGKVNLNSASQAELETLPGLGPSKAGAIIDYRNQNGPFQTEDDLKKVSGIGEKTFEKLKELIRVQ